MPSLPIPLAAAAALWCCLPAAAEPLAVGVVAPLSGPSAPLGGQVVAGARAAATTAGQARIRLEQADDACTAAGGREAAQRLVAARVRAVVGFLCAESIDAAMPALAAAGIPVITVGVRANSLTDERARTGWTLARLGPRADGEGQAAGRFVAGLWADVPFAIVDDGTIYGRNLSESVREAVEAAGLKPVFADTYRPASESQSAFVQRLAGTGAVRVFAGGERSDIAVMSRDGAAAGMLFAGGEALRDEPGPVGLAAGTLMVALPDAADSAAPDAVAAVRAAGTPAEGYALPAFAAVEIVEAALAGGGGAASPFDGRAFGTAIGPVRFDGKGDLAENPYRLFRYDGQRFVPFDAP